MYIEVFILLLVVVIVLVSSYFKRQRARFLSALINSLLEANLHEGTLNDKAAKIIANMAYFSDYKDYARHMQNLCGMLGVPYALNTETNDISERTHRLLVECLANEMLALNDRLLAGSEQSVG